MSEAIQAFPTTAFDVPFADARNPKYLGMSLRDYFATKALASIVNRGGVLWNEQDAANRAYAYADAMLKAREAK